MSFLAMCSSVTGQERGLGPGGAVSETEPYVAQGGDNAPFDCTCTKIEIKIEGQDVVTTPFAIDEVREGTVKWWINGNPNAQLCVEVWTEPTPEKTPHRLPSATFQWQHRSGEPFRQSDRFTTNCADGEREFKIMGGPEVSPTVLGSKMIVKIYPGPCTPSRPDPICRSDIKFTVLKLDLLQYEQPSGTWNDISGTLYVLKNSTVTFQAVPTPLVTWPSGMPVWGGTSGASGAGETKAVTFNTLSTTLTDYKTVTATCGDTKTAKFVVYELTGTLTPDDNFANRSQSKYGLEETVDLAFTTDPAGISAVQAGGLEWTRNSGVGAVSSAGNDGTADYDAEHAAGNATLRLTIKSGPSKDEFKSYDRTVVAPDDEYMTQKSGSSIRHTTNTCSAGFLGWSYLTPKDVSFSNLNRREGTCTGTGSGFYAYLNGKGHDTGSWWPVSTGNSATGCRVLVDDRVYSGAKGSPYSDGQFDWPIPREYEADDGVPHQIRIANHNQVADSAGKCTIQKEGAGPFSKNAGDPTSSW
jgi:hypothetical protein